MNRPKRSPNWCSSRPTCKNDGHQFTAKSKGKFSKAKRDLLDFGSGGNYTEVEEVSFFEDGEIDEDDEEYLELDEGEDDVVPAMEFSPDGDSAAISARWTEEDGFVPFEDEKEE